MNIPLLFRGFGVLFAIVFFLNAPTWWREPWPEDIIGYVLPGLLLMLSALICIPFSRIRSVRFFWALVTTYATAFLAVVAVHAWSAFHEIGTPKFFFHFLLVGPVVLLLLVQLPCILYSWRHRKHEP
jgi:hypothetical protein